jgi:2-C-methyl-D-erythritol 2,4-cyclodiphosphate synthase
LSKPNIRIGFGFDVHQLIPGSKMILGGVEIPSNVSAKGHSDADVLIHAICDALLGALNLRDIGYHFPDNEKKYKGISSVILLEEVVGKIDALGWGIINIDATLVLEYPKINPHIEAMQKILAEAMKIAPEDISIKATTNEKLDSIGNRKGVNAHAVALVYKK